MSEELA